MKTPTLRTVGPGSTLPNLLPRFAWPLLILGAVLALVQPCLGAPFTFEETGSLATARSDNTVTLLPNGKVLVVGGRDLPGNQLATAELYDPATGNWTAIGSLATARQDHTATLLPNGKVLVAGGFDSTRSFSSSAELYDPATGSWTTTGSLVDPRENHTATLLPNGKVLVAGGDGDNGMFSYFSRGELYDPATGTWTTTGSMTTPRALHTATLLPSGKVLVAAGRTTYGTLATAELYDPATGSWTKTGSLASERIHDTATLLPNGKVLVTGGGVDFTSTVLASAELYDPATGSWTATGSLNAAREYHTAALLPDGQVMLAGGFDKTFAALKSAELFDPASGSWTTMGNMTTARGAHTDSLLPNGKVLVLGGSDGAGGLLASAELYDSALGMREPTQLVNSSTRLPVGVGDNVGISGFIIRGNGLQMVLVRGLGPSLNVGGMPLPGLLQDPILQIVDAQGRPLALNDNWQDTQSAEITATGLAPTNPPEAAILMELAPGAYTALISGVANTTGNALVEVYALSSSFDSDLGNISTRGQVQTGDNVLIGGAIIMGENPAQVLFRAIGPELTESGVAGALQDPTLDLYDSNGVLLQSNDNWQDMQSAEIAATGLAPTDPSESAILATLTSGGYTAIVRGKDGTTGVALVEEYNLSSPLPAAAR